MEESASHHVIMNEMCCFLLRLRRRKRIFNAPGPSQIHFLCFETFFKKMKFSSFLEEIWGWRFLGQRLPGVAQVAFKNDQHNFLYNGLFGNPVFCDPGFTGFQDLMDRSYEISKGPDEPEGPTRIQRWRRVLRTILVTLTSEPESQNSS